MKPDRRIILNTSLRWTGEILNKLIWMAFFVVLARCLGTREFGYFSYAFSIGSVFVILTDFGTNTLITKEVSRDPARANYYFINVLGIKLFLSLLCLALTAAAALLFMDVPKLVILFTLSLIISAFWDPVNALFRAYKEMYFEALILLFWRVILVGGSLAGLYYFHFGLLRVSLVFIASSAATLALAFWLIKKTHGITLNDLKEIDTSLWKGIVMSSLPIALIMITGGLIFKFNVVLLQHFRDAQEVGWYSAAFKLIESTLFIPSFFVASLFPFFCENNKDCRISEYGHALFKKSFALLAGAALLISAAGYALSGPIINLLYGAAFAPASAAFNILIWVVIFMSLNELFNFLFLSIERQMKTLYFVLATLVFYLALCYYLIPRYGMAGASWALVAAEAALFAQNSVFFARIKWQK